MSSRDRIHRSNKHASIPEPLKQPHHHFSATKKEGNAGAIIQRARLDSDSLSPRDVLQLQRRIGNRGVKSLLAEVAQRQHADNGINPPTRKKSSTTATLPGAGKRNYDGVVRAIANPIVVDAQQFYSLDEVVYPTLGFTTKPKGNEGPDIDYNIEDVEGKKKAKPKWETKADEGTNESHCLAAGTHQVPGEKENGKDVYIRLDDQIAKSVKDAEEEHNKDFRYAAEQVLTAGENYLEDNIIGKEFGGFETEDEVMEAVDKKINEELGGQLGIPEFDWVNLPSYYIKACYQTEKRDTEEWHTFDNELESETEDKITYKITGEGTEINQHAASEIIDLTKIEFG
jgi:hypothetical protein